jgi:hypothetical protein
MFILPAISIGLSIVTQRTSAFTNSTRIALEGRVTTLHVSPQFTTTIQLPDQVSSVVVGNPTLFQAEHSPNEPMLVFVKPLSPATAETNLVITTAAGRHFSLLLKNLSEGDRSESSVDLFVLCRTAGTSFIEDSYPNSLISETLSLAAMPDNPENPPRPIPIQNDSFAGFFERQRRRPLANAEGGRLRVAIGEVIDQNTKFIVVFSVLNSTDGPVELMTPQVQLAGQAKSRHLRHTSRWTTVEQIPLIEFHLDKRKLNRGDRADGLIVFERPALKQSNETLLLQIAEAAMVDQPVLVPINFSVSSNREEKRD